jgi:PAS domain-containing protein
VAQAKPLWSNRYVDIRNLGGDAIAPLHPPVRQLTMDDPGTTKERLLSDLARLRQKLAELEASESRRQTADVTERQHAELSALGAAVGLSLTHADSLPHALQQCAQALVTHLEAAFARIWTLNERDGMLELRASAGLYTHLDGPHGRVPLGQFKIGRIAQDRTPLLTNAVLGDSEVSDQDWARREGMVAFAGHPLIVDRRVVGVMALFARHPLPEAVVSAMGSVADHIALGIERHRTAGALRAAEERMRFALGAAGVGIWDMDYTTGVLQWSGILESHYGLSGSIPTIGSPCSRRSRRRGRRAPISRCSTARSGLTVRCAG